MFGSVRAQIDLQLAMGFGSVCAQAELAFFLACSGIKREILFRNLSGIHSDILSGILFDIKFDIRSCILSGILSDIYFDILFGSIWDLFRHSIWHLFSQNIWYLFWHSFWHSCRQSIWHLIWHSFWQSICRLLWHSIWPLLWHLFRHFSGIHQASILTFSLACVLVCVRPAWPGARDRSRVRVCPNWREARQKLLERDYST